MKKWLVLALLSFSLPIVHAQETYDLSPEVINSAPSRSTYYISDSFFSLNASEFLEKADRTKPVVIHLHGCGGVSFYDNDLKSFYTKMGMNFVMTNFLKRSDTRASCYLDNGRLVYTANKMARGQARTLEMERHISWLRENGFERIILTGHSEGGSMVQMVNSTVDKVVIHSTGCLLGIFVSNPNNKFLQLVSTNDSQLKGIMGTLTCSTSENVRVITTSISSHHPLADAQWKSEIQKFLSQ